ncbi:short-chain-enoyl-CoA hydratase [Heliorestis convoluta]|uniref:Short-chain-enoyl-CoA hydratase n=1 Tax=Heliorestis convoluta TaxID=356322 RepID=A0A5Q2N2F0_9FIRM|nr:short-chain-enoyl-CoA hydratase [Heliorestis convoluta]
MRKETKTVLYQQENAVALLTINRPTVLNALNRQVFHDLESLFDQIAVDESVGAVVITGAGEKSFVAGADIAEMAQYTPLEARAFAQQGQRVFSKMEKIPQPVIAAIQGYALGGGCELALACDIRYGSPKAKLGQPEVNLGVLPGFGGSQRLPRLIGKGRASELLLTGDIIDSTKPFALACLTKSSP